MKKTRKVAPKERNFFICPDLSMGNSHRQQEFLHTSTTLKNVKPMTMRYMQLPGTFNLGGQVVTAGLLHHTSFYNMCNWPLQFFYFSLWLLVHDDVY